MAAPDNGYTIEPEDSPSSQITVAPSLLHDESRLFVYVAQDNSEFGETDDAAAVWLTVAEAKQLRAYIEQVLDNA